MIGLLSTTLTLEREGAVFRRPEEELVAEAGFVERGGRDGLDLPDELGDGDFGWDAGHEMDVIFDAVRPGFHKRRSTLGYGFRRSSSSSH